MDNIDINDVHQYICQNHDEIVKLCDIIINTNMLDDCAHENGLIEIIRDRAIQAKYQGMQMEKRLKLYRNAIEKLGFVRVDKTGV